MDKLVSRLIVYQNIEEESVLKKLANIYHDWNTKTYSKEEIIPRVYKQIHRILDVATTYGFNHDLWQDYLTYLLITTENPFSIALEKVGATDGSVNTFVMNDFHVFYQLFHFDFSKLEKELKINCFEVIRNYHAIPKLETSYNKNVSIKVRSLSEKLAKAESTEKIYELVTEFYKNCGVGMFGLNKAFRIEHFENGAKILPITNLEEVRFTDIIGYEAQKKKLRENTEAFLAGKKANNVLLFGDSGTGKSTSIKALLNEYYDQGLRMIEIYKHQFQDLSKIIARIKNRNYRFIIYMDDLSFEEFEIEYKYLKAVIEGGLEIKPENVLIYATSNRRHLIRETWSDRSDISQDELHQSDTMQEKLSLVARFGVSIHYGKPDKKQFNEIVEGIARQYPEITLTKEELFLQANQWELSHGGLSGRCASQFVHYLLGKH